MTVSIPLPNQTLTSQIMSISAIPRHRAEPRGTTSGPTQTDDRGVTQMQGEAKGRLTELGWPSRGGLGRRRDDVPPCGDPDTCACRPDDRVTVADMERMAAALGMRLSELLA